MSQRSTRARLGSPRRPACDNQQMFQIPPSLQRFAFPLLALVVLAGAWRAFGLAGLALASAGLIMVVLLHFTRLMHILRKAADRPIGHVTSAVMLNAKLKPNVNLVHVMALTRSLGALQTPPESQPEIFRWRDNSDSYVDCEFHQGKLARWTLTRPAASDDTVEAGPAPGDGRS
ncbi:MAG: glycerate kinase [Comamonas sp.]